MFCSRLSEVFPLAFSFNHLYSGFLRRIRKSLNTDRLSPYTRSAKKRGRGWNKEFVEDQEGEWATVLPVVPADGQVYIYIYTHLGTIPRKTSQRVPTRPTAARRTSHPAGTRLRSRLIPYARPCALPRRYDDDNNDNNNNIIIVTSYPTARPFGFCV